MKLEAKDPPFSPTDTYETPAAQRRGTGGGEAALGYTIIMSNSSPTPKHQLVMWLVVFTWLSLSGLVIVPQL